MDRPPALRRGEARRFGLRRRPFRTRLASRLAVLMQYPSQNPNVRCSSTRSPAPGSSPRRRPSGDQAERLPFRGGGAARGAHLPWGLQAMRQSVPRRFGAMYAASRGRHGRPPSDFPMCPLPLCCGLSMPPSSPDAAFRNPTLPIAARVDDLLARMTLAEKVGQMLQLDGADDRSRRSSREAGRLDVSHPERAAGRRRWTAAAATRLRHSAADRRGRHPRALVSCRARPSSRPSSRWRRPGTPPCSSGSRGSPRARWPTTGSHWTFSPVLCLTRDQRWGRTERDVRRGPVPDRRAGRGDDPRLPGRGPGRSRRRAGLRQALRRLLGDAGRAGRVARPTSHAASCAASSCRRSSAPRGGAA